MSVHLPRAGPTLGAAQHDHGPTRARPIAVPARLILDSADLQDAVLERSCHRLVHALVFTAFNKIGSVPVTDKQRLEFLMTDASQDGGVVNFITVEVQYGKNRSVSNRIEKFVT